MQPTLTTNSPRAKMLALLLIVSLFIGIGFLFARVFGQLPIEGTSLALDWRNIYDGINRGDLIYYTTRDGLRNPPWSIFPIVPLTWVEFQAGWGLLTLCTLTSLIIAVPRVRKKSTQWLIVALLLATSHGSLRLIADGNVELLVIGGVLLILYGCRIQHPVWLAAGVLCATAKPQEIWLLLLALPVFMLQTWKRPKIVQAALIVVPIVVIASIWRGREWLAALVEGGQVGQGTPLDISWLSVSGQLGVAGWLFALVWLAILLVTLWVTVIVLRRRAGLRRELAGFLLCASLALSSYAAGNVVLTVMALAIVPLYVTNFALTVALIGVNNIAYVLPVGFQQQNMLYISLIFVLTAWMFAGIAALRRSQPLPA